MRIVLAALSLALTFIVAPGGVARGQATPPAPPATDSIELLKKPMVFYVARGEPDACGPGCNEWIAAEGAFDTGAAVRLRAFISRPRNARLPIYFHSPGGLADRAFTIGRILRERGTTAGVSRTLPEACGKLDDKACDALKRSGQVLTAELSAMAACNSACVYALIGAKMRQVPPGAQFGVHSAKLIKLYSDGRIVAIQPSAAKTQASARNVSIRKYIAEMGIDAKLFELASNTPHESIHYLSRDEIAGLRIDPREFQETGWMLVQSRQVSVRKLFIEAKGPERKQYRVSIVDFSCGGSRGIQLVYVRGLASDEGSKGEISGFVIDGKEILMLRLTPAFKLDAVDPGGSFDRWDRFEPIEFLEAVAKHDSLEIGAGPAGRRLASISVKLSTAGLSNAIGALRKKCRSSDPYFPTLRPWGLTQ